MQINRLAWAQPRMAMNTSGSTPKVLTADDCLFGHQRQRHAQEDGPDQEKCGRDHEEAGQVIR